MCYHSAEDLYIKERDNNPHITKLRWKDSEDWLPDLYCMTNYRREGLRRCCSSCSSSHRPCQSRCWWSYFGNLRHKPYWLLYTNLRLKSCCKGRNGIGLHLWPMKLSSSSDTCNWNLLQLHNMDKVPASRLSITFAPLRNPECRNCLHKQKHTDTFQLSKAAQTFLTSNKRKHKPWSQRSLPWMYMTYRMC